MNKHRFLESLRDPSKLKDNEVEELDQLIKDFPYFQGARVLSAKVSKEKNKADVSRRVASAAVYVTDRALLKKYINDHLFIIDSKDRQKKVAEEGVDETAVKKRVRPSVRRSQDSNPDEKKRITKPQPKVVEKTKTSS
ncbi:MAG: hypothetical protein AAFN93_28730, partial [Bacteroidota bacterium]